MLAARGVQRVDLGGAAGHSDASDGLARFKQGWANEEHTAWLGGRILDADGYARCSGTSVKSDYFPAYRARIAA